MTINTGQKVKNGFGKITRMTIVYYFKMNRKGVKCLIVNNYKSYQQVRRNKQEVVNCGRLIRILFPISYSNF